MGSSILGIGISGLHAAQAGLVTTGHNIANASTPGYSRQRNIQETALPQATGAGFFGQGTNIATVERLYSQFLAGQALDAEAKSAGFDAYATMIGQLDNMLADPNSGLSPALNDFFIAVQGVANDPSSAPARQAMLASAQTLVARFRMMDDQLAAIRASLNPQIEASVGSINSYAAQIARLNNDILAAQSRTGGQPPNDLMDQRDQLLVELNREIGATALLQSDGSYVVLIGNGQPLVVGVNAYRLATVPDQGDPSRVTVALAVQGGTVALKEDGLKSGRLGGMLAFRSEVLDAATSELGRVAIALADAFNDQHRLGQDLNGALGQDFFTLPAPTVMAGAANAGSAAISGAIVDANALTGSDYRLEFDGTNYRLTRLSDSSQQLFAALPQTVDGFSLTLSSGALAAGDQFLIRPTGAGASGIAVKITDAAKVAAASPIRTNTALANAGSAKINAGAVSSFNDRVTLTFTSATTFNVVDDTTGATLAQNMAYTAGGDISFNGWTVQISGIPAAGNTFTVDRTVTSTTSTTATIISTATLNTPSPSDPFLANGISIVFDSATSFHLEGTTTNVAGASTITGGTFAPGLPLAAGANTGITVTNGAAIIGTGGAGAYTSTGVKVTISGGTIGVAAGIATVSGATITVEGGSYQGSTTFKGVNITVDNVTGAIGISAAGASGIASTFRGRPATGIAYSATATNLLSVNGWTVELTGLAAAGDTFSVASNTGGIADNRNALLLAGLQQQKIVAGSTATLQSAYGQLVAGVGTQAREINIARDASETMLQKATRAQQDYSGVNLDEEAANLLRYQQAYQAAGKMMQIADKTFQTLLDLGD